MNKDYLFVHQNMPGQFLNLAPAIAAQTGARVVFIGQREGIRLPGVQCFSYPKPRGASANTHSYARLLEASIRRGQAAARLGVKLRSQGFSPGVIIAHPGWGEALFLRDIWPHAVLITYAEFYYKAHGQDLGFEGHAGDPLDAICRARIRNSHLLLSLDASEAAISPTEWQRSVHPAAYRSRIRVIHDGIDTDRIGGIVPAGVSLPDGTMVAPGDEIITYVARNLEPYRGFHIAMRALPAILEARPSARAIIVGGDEVSYGRAAPGGGTWRERMIEEAGLARFGDRIVFCGRIAYRSYLMLLRLTSVHLYLTYPFVLSWSCLEAMAAGALIVASETPPVTEVIEDGVNGLLVSFHDVDALARRTIEALAMGDAARPLRIAARRTVVERYALADMLEAQTALIAAHAG